MWLAGLIGYIIYSDLRTRNAWDAVERGKLLARTLSGRQLTLTSMVFFCISYNRIRFRMCLLLRVKAHHYRHLMGKRWLMCCSRRYCLLNLERGRQQRGPKSATVSRKEIKANYAVLHLSNVHKQRRLSGYRRRKIGNTH